MERYFASMRSSVASADAGDERRVLVGEEGDEGGGREDGADEIRERASTGIEHISNDGAVADVDVDVAQPSAPHHDNDDDGVVVIAHGESNKNVVSSGSKPIRSYQNHFLKAARDSVSVGSSCFSFVHSPHHFISNPFTMMRRALTAEVLPHRMRVTGSVRIRTKHVNNNNGTTLLRRSFGCDIEMDNSGSLLAEAYSGLNGRLVIHRFSDIRNRVEAIRQYEIDKENEGDGIVNCGNNIDNDDDTNYTSEEERCRKRQRTYKVQLRGCYASQYEEALGLNTGRDLTSCTWCPADQDIVACCSASDTEIHLYDLKYCGNRPSERLVFQKSEASHGRYDGGRRPGLSSLRFKDGSGNVVIAGSEAGDILAFDRRTKQSINTILSPAENVGGFNCIAIHPDGNSVIGGTLNGRVCFWDIRGGLGSNQREMTRAFSMASRNQITKQLPANSLWPAHLLRRITELSNQTEIANCAVHSTILDPKDSNRLGIHLSSGWSVVVDLHREQITHLHCPPLDRFTSDVAFSVALDGGTWEQRGFFHTSWWRVRRRRCCWAGNGNLFCSPSSEASSPPPAVHVLDFSSSIRSQCRVDVIDVDSFLINSSLRSENVSAPRVDSTVTGKKKIELEAPGVAIAAHPTTDELLVADVDGKLNLIGTRL